METVLPDAAQPPDRTRHRRRRPSRKARRQGRRLLCVALLATAWLLTIAGAYEIVSAYASTVRDPDGNAVGGGLFTAMIEFTVCAAASGVCLFLAQRLRR